MPQAPPGWRVDDQAGPDLDTRPVDEGALGRTTTAATRPGLRRAAGRRRRGSTTRRRRPAGRHGSRHDYVVLKGRRRNGHRVLVVLGIIAAVLAVLGVGAWWWYQRQIDPPGPPGEAIRVVIPSGTSTSGIGSLLDDEDVIANGTVWNLYTSRKHAGPFQAGTYTLRKNSDLDSVIDVMEAGPTRRTSSGAYLPAGLTVAELETQLSKSVERFTVPSIQRALSSGAVTSSLQPPGQASWEGLLYPGTYTISRHTAVADFLQKLSTKMEQAVAAQRPEAGDRRDQREVGSPPVDLRRPRGRLAHPARGREQGRDAEDRDRDLQPAVQGHAARHRCDVGVRVEAERHRDRLRLGLAVQHPHVEGPPADADLHDQRRRVARRAPSRRRTVEVLRPRGEGPAPLHRQSSVFAKGVEQCKAKHLGCG